MVVYVLCHCMSEVFNLPFDFTGGPVKRLLRVSEETLGFQVLRLWRSMRILELECILCCYMATCLREWNVPHLLRYLKAWSSVVNCLRRFSRYGFAGRNVSLEVGSQTLKICPILISFLCLWFEIWAFRSQFPAPLPCLLAAMLPSETVSPNKLFLLQVALDMVLYQSSGKQTSRNQEHY